MASGLQVVDVCNKGVEPFGNSGSLKITGCVLYCKHSGAQSAYMQNGATKN